MLLKLCDQALTQELARSLVHYDESTGLFTRLVAIRGRGEIGSTIGYVGGHGYLVISIAGRSVLAHRLAWLYMTGAWPAEHVDHRDTDRLNNRWANLRAVSLGENNQNSRKARQHSRSGLLGVYEQGSRWYAQIKVNRKAIHLGAFDTAEQAHAAYVAAKRRLHTGCTL